jgi:hypothetical protein
MTKSTFARYACGAILFGLLAGVLPLESEGQIIFRNIDPRKMEVVPLTKPDQPSLPYLPKPELEQEDILPDRIQFTPIPKENIVPEDLRQNRLMTDWMPKDTIVQQSIAPPWFRHDIIGPERAEPAALPPRGSFRYQSPIFLPAVKPQPGLDDSMLLTPTPFTDRPIDARQGRSSTNKAPTPARAQAERTGPRSLGW